MLCSYLPHHDEYRNEHGAYWVGQHPVKHVDQGRGDDHTNTAKGVRQYVQENACKVQQHLQQYLFVLTGIHS